MKNPLFSSPSSSTKGKISPCQSWSPCHQQNRDYVLKLVPTRSFLRHVSGVVWSKSRGGGGGKKFPLPKLRHHFCLSKNDVIEVLREKSSPCSSSTTTTTTNTIAAAAAAAPPPWLLPLSLLLRLLLDSNLVTVIFFLLHLVRERIRRLRDTRILKMTPEEGISRKRGWSQLDIIVAFRAKLLVLFVCLFVCFSIFLSFFFPTTT